jgi:hypothetical protein
MGIGEHFYTISSSERDAATNNAGYHWEEIGFYVLWGAGPNVVPLYRLLNSKVGDHFYTISTDERDKAIANNGYHLEGIACYVYATQIPGTVPLYRLDNGPGDHFYTISTEERDTQIATGGYRLDGIGCYVFASRSQGAVPMYRLWNRPFALQQAIAFQVTSISYDLANAVMLGMPDQTLYSTNLTNGSDVQQSQELDGQQTVQETTAWSCGVTFKIGTKASGDVGIPGVANGKVEVSTELGFSFSFNESETVARQWSWKQPVIVPAHTEVTASISVSESHVSVPYVATGQLVFMNKQTVPAMQEGIYAGVSSHDLTVVISNVTAALKGGPSVSDEVIAVGGRSALADGEPHPWLGAPVALG